MKYKDFAGDEVEVPEAIDNFIKEYEILCKKHKLMIISDGEPIIVDTYEKSLWNIRKSIAGELIQKIW